jgi:hypothetical protein
MSAAKLHALIGLSKMKEEALQNYANSLVKVGSQSPLFANAGIAAGIAAITAKVATYKAGCQTVKDAAQQLVDDKATRDADRASLETEISAYGATACNVATDDAGLASLGITPRPQVVIPKVAPAVPTGFKTRMPKHLKGYFDISVEEPAGTRGNYAAQWSPDPIGTGTWTDLPGTGKSRRVTGASGTKVWVRFARVRGQSQSDWSAPQLVVIP